MNSSTNDKLFLLFYAPLFFVKLLTIDAGNNILKVVAVGCFAVFFLYMVVKKRYKQKEFVFWILGGAYLSILVITCGKEGALFSFIAMILMRYTHRTRNRSVLFFVGLIGVPLGLYMTRGIRTAIRFDGVAWVSMTKRSNIAFISFYAVVTLYLMTYKNVKMRVIAIISGLTYLVYRYTGCRTGIVCAGILLVLLVIFKSERIRKSKVVKILAMSIPTLCMAASIVVVYMYNAGNSWAIFINSLTQGRIKLGCQFVNTYNPKIFGQPLAENKGYLDSAYLDMYLCYGILFTIIWIVFTTIVIKWLFEKENYIGIAIIVSYAVFGTGETFLPNCFLNPSLLLYGEYLMEKFKLGQDYSRPVFIKWRKSRYKVWKK